MTIIKLMIRFIKPTNVSFMVIKSSFTTDGNINHSNKAFHMAKTAYLKIQLKPCCSQEYLPGDGVCVHYCCCVFRGGGKIKLFRFSLLYTFGDFFFLEYGNIRDFAVKEDDPKELCKIKYRYDIVCNTIITW